MLLWSVNICCILGPKKMHQHAFTYRSPCALSSSGVLYVTMAAQPQVCHLLPHHHFPTKCHFRPIKNVLCKNCLKLRLGTYRKLLHTCEHHFWNWHQDQWQIHMEVNWKLCLDFKFYAIGISRQKSIHSEVHTSHMAKCVSVSFWIQHTIQYHCHNLNGLPLLLGPPGLLSLGTSSSSPRERLGWWLLSGTKNMVNVYCDEPEFWRVSSDPFHIIIAPYFGFLGIILGQLALLFTHVLCFILLL